MSNLTTRRQLVLAGAAALSTAWWPQGASAQAWPSKPVRLVVPFPPGGLIDQMARLMAPRLAREIGQPVVIDNKPGAGGNVGAAEAARAPADGYTLLMASPPLTISPAIYPSLPYRPEQIVPIGVVGRVPNVLLVNPKSGLASVADLVARVDPSLFDDHAPVQPVLARLVSGEPAAAILPDVRDPGVQRALAAVCARATLVEEADAARATCDVLARLQRPRRKAQLAVHTDEVSAFLRDGDTAAYRVAAARRAALVQTEKALETALTQGEVGSAIALLAAWPAPPWTTGST